jgi:hypothetical protein
LSGHKIVVGVVVEPLEKSYFAGVLSGHVVLLSGVGLKVEQLHFPRGVAHP